MTELESLREEVRALTKRVADLEARQVTPFHYPPGYMQDVGEGHAKPWPYGVASARES